MSIIQRISFNLALTGALFWPVASMALAGEDSAAAAAKRIFTDKQDCVVWVSAVSKITFTSEGGRDTGVNIPDREQKSEALGTIIDQSGMLVTALSSIDPSRDYSGREFRTREGTVKLDATAIMKEVKIIMPDGTEIPGELVMRDVDLDLAFVRPKPGAKEAKGIVYQSLDLKDGASVSVTDDAISLSRTDEVLNRVASVSRGQIMSITKKPREFLRATGSSLGCPVFAIDGKLIGISVSRTVKGKASQTVIIPAADVLEIAEQARAAKPNGEKKEKKGEPAEPVSSSEGAGSK